MTRRRSRALWAGGLRALACATLIGCDIDRWGAGTPGLVEVWVSAPEAHDQAWLIAFDRPVDRFAAAPGFEHFGDGSRRSATVLIVAATPAARGETLVGTFPVGDIRDAARLDATVVEAARSDHVLRDGTAGYRIRLAW